MQRWISQLFFYGSITLMAHFEAYITHMDMENYNETHSLTKKLARTFQSYRNLQQQHFVCTVVRVAMDRKL